MRAEAFWFVVTPDGHVSEPSVAFSREGAIGAYMHEWLPPRVKLGPSSYMTEQLWKAFEEAGYAVIRVYMPDEKLAKAAVCRT